MNYIEAIHILGLKEGASKEEIKAAYRELAQIMHPDRFAQNERLANKASEQFKLITKAKDLLLSDKASGAATHAQSETKSDNKDSINSLQIRYNAAETARLTLLSYLDAENDHIRTYGLMAGAGILASFGARRFPWILAIASVLAVTGIVNVIRSVMQKRDLEEQIQALEDEKRKIMLELTQQK
ncbi:MAG: J domain-containing protein [Coriobacteriia bacterium]|nr:J domain-containing protein [Coriobacteriia bacterium]